MTAPSPRWFWLVWSLLTLWLIACAILVQGEYGDGYQTIVNARYFFGGSPDFYVQRGPLAAVALWPVEMLVQLFDGDPLDVRPYHGLSAAVHSLYLAGCWLLLQKIPGPPLARLLAFAAAVLSVLFYAYAPFLSHDLLPGLLFLLMIFLSHRWLEQQRLSDAVWLILIGAGVVLIKQTYAIFWIAIVAYALVGFAFKFDQARITLGKAAAILGFAATSAAITWLAFGLYMAPLLPDAPLLLRPATLVGAVGGQYGEPLEGLFVPDLYLRNLHNFGIAAVLLVIPGVVLALRGRDARLRQVGICWIIAVIIMQWVPFKEVRYLAFLAPLTAALLVPAVSLLISRRVVLALLIVLLAFDQTRGLRTAIKPLTSTASIDVARFLNSPADGERIFMSRTMSFAYHAGSPLQRDRYHGIYHLTPDTFYRLNRGRVHITGLIHSGRLGSVGIQAGDEILFANSTLVRSPPWKSGNRPTDLDEFLLIAGNAATLDLTRSADDFVIDQHDGSYVMFLPHDSTGEQMPAIGAGPLPLQTAKRLYGDLSDAEQLSVLGVRVTAICRADNCSYRDAEN